MIILCYKNYKIGCLDYDGDVYTYRSLPDKQKFLKEYGFIKFNLADIDEQTYKNMPKFFADFVEKLIQNSYMATKLNINLTRDSYYDILFRYSQLPQMKNTFYFIKK